MGPYRIAGEIKTSPTISPFQKKLQLFVDTSFLNQFRFFRWLVGGRWELWFVDFPVGFYVWHLIEYIPSYFERLSSGLGLSGNLELSR